MDIPWFDVMMGVLTFVAVIFAVLTIRAVVDESKARREQAREEAQWRREGNQRQYRQGQVEKALEYRRSQLQRLCELRAALQYVGNEGTVNILERERSYGEAYSLILSLPSQAVRNDATTIMENPDYSAKNAAVDRAIIFLGDIVNELDRAAV